MEEILIGLIAKYPIVASFLSIIGLIRLLVKPIMEIIKAYVQYTPTKEDDSFVNKVITSSAYNKFYLFLIGCFQLRSKSSVVHTPNVSGSNQIVVTNFKKLKEFKIDKQEKILDEIDNTSDSSIIDAAHKLHESKKINSTCLVLNGSTCVVIDQDGKQEIVPCAGFVCMNKHDYIEFTKSCNLD